MALALGSVDENLFYDLVKRGKLTQRLGGGASLAVGVGILYGAPFFGTVGILAGLVIVLLAGSSEKSRVQKVKTSLEELKMALQNRP